MEEVIEISKPEELIIWNEMANTEIRLTKDDASLLLGYLEGHDYQLGVDQGILYRRDLQDAKECIPYSLDEIIDLVCEWNYELIEDNEKCYEKAETQELSEMYEKKIASLKEDEEKLNGLFAMTRYGKQVVDLARQMIVAAGGTVPEYMQVSERIEYEQEKEQEQLEKQSKEEQGR